MTRVEEEVRLVAGSPILPGIRVRLEGKLTRPPLEPNAQTEGLLKLEIEVGREMSMEMTPKEEYGDSDGCFSAALGVATLDGMGPLCHDMCGDLERIELDSHSEDHPPGGNHKPSGMGRWSGRAGIVASPLRRLVKSTCTLLAVDEYTWGRRVGTGFIVPTKIV
jgi:hypothetical protein